MPRIKNFLDALFELSIRYCGDEGINQIKQILTRAEQLELELVLKNKREDNTETNYDIIRIQFYSDNLLSFCKNKLKELSFYNYLIEFGQLCLDFGEINFAEYVFTYIINNAGNQSKLERLTSQALSNRAEVYIRSSRWKNADEDLRKAKKLYLAKKDKKHLAIIENLSGIVKSEKGNIKSALKNFNEALKIFSKSKDELWIGILEMNIGNINTIQGNWEEAYAHYKRALTAFEKLMDLKRLALVRHNLGMLFKNQGELQAALTEFDRSLEYAIEGNYLLAKGLAYLGKGDVYAKLEEYALATEFCNKAMEVFYKIMDKVGLADTYKIKGVVQRDISNNEIAETYLLTSLRLSEEIESILNYAEAAYELGILYRKWQKQDLAKRYLKLSEAYFTKVGAKDNLERVKIIINRTENS